MDNASSRVDASRVGPAARPRSTELSMAFGRSAGLLLMPAWLALLAANTLLRDMPWTREWLWATYQYHYATVLLGPAVAAVATWEQARCTRHHGDPRAVRSAAVARWAALLVWVSLSYLIGLVTVFIYMKSSGMPGWPGPVEAASLAPPIALLAAQAALGSWVGVRSGKRWLAPAVGAACFLVILACYQMFGPANPLVVGGATASLIGIKPRPELQLAQVVFCALGAAALLHRARPRAPSDVGRRRGRRSNLVLGLSIATSAIALFELTGDNQFAPTDPQLQCVNGTVIICAAPGYVDRIPAVEQALQPHLQALREAGVSPPIRFEQNAAARGAHAADISAPLASVPPVIDPAGLLNWWLPYNCEPGTDDAVLQAYFDAYDWLTIIDTAHAEATGEVEGSTDNRIFVSSLTVLQQCRGPA